MSSTFVAPRPYSEPQPCARRRRRWQYMAGSSVTSLQWKAFKLAHVDGLTSRLAGKILRRSAAAIRMLVMRFKRGLPNWWQQFPARGC